MSDTSDDDVTELLAAAQLGAPGAADRLIAAVHAELRRLAEGKMANERAAHTLQPTALVNEAYLRLRGNVGDLQDRAHFFGAAARAMERVLVDHARRKAAQKRGKDAARVTLQDLDVVSPHGNLDLYEVRDAIELLEQQEPGLAALVRYRYFIGLTLEQIAEIEATSLATVKRRWTYARAWLYERLGT
ncbi:MAG: ECF-type sigma factor [bacterium]|nr:ECF-type sigma factor [bacterium]